MTAVNLLFDNPNGTQKFWRASYDPAKDRIVLEYGRVGTSPRSSVIPRADFSKPTAPDEIEHRAQKKRSSGYYEVVNTKDEADAKPRAKPASKPSSTNSKRSELMVAIEQGGEGPIWFF